MRGPDAAVRALGSRGIGVLGIVDYAPSWANGGNGQMYPPTNATDFATYAAFLVRHFAPMGIHTWEDIRNEPNLKVYWATGADTRTVHAIAEGGVPRHQGRGFRCDRDHRRPRSAASSGGDLTPMDFLTGIYANGGRGFFDAVADHPYTYPAMPDDKSGGAYWWDAMNDLRAIMTAHGDADKSTWMTEYGAPTNGPAAARFIA